MARGQEIDRTGVDTNEAMAVELEFAGLGRVDVVIPDTSGESLRVLVESRIWHSRLLDACTGATAIALFVHPARVRVPQPLAARRAPPAPPDSEAQAPAPFDVHDHASTAGELIDVFENLTELCRQRWPIRIAVIVSA